MNYEISTIRDIYEKIPADRIADCMAKLSLLMILAETTKQRKSYQELAQDSGYNLMRWQPIQNQD